MFLEWIQALSFLTKTDEEGIFLTFPTTSRRVIAKEVTEVLLKGSVPMNTIKSNVNVKVLMECVGQCFGLPVHDCAEIISAATELYRRWLFESDLRPPPVSANQDLFFLEILKHTSLLFQPRTALAKEVVPVHVKLCESVLEVYRRLAKDIPMSKNLWERFIEIMISIADFLLKKRVEDEPLADRLTPNILRVFLLSQTKNDRLWDALKILLNEWRHRRPVILQWNAMCLGLTARAMRLLYGPAVGHDQILFQLDEVPPSQFQLPEEYTLYAWARILCAYFLIFKDLLGDLELIPTGPNYADAMKGIQALTNYLIAVKPPSGALAVAQPNAAPFRTPDGNTVLKLVGHWIFEAINNYKQQGYEKGKAYALETSCVLFCSKSRTVFNARYLAFLYRGLEEAMKLRHPALSAVIVMNLTSFFPNEFPGCNVLIPSLVYTVARILLEVGTSNAQLRRSCIRLVGTLLCYPNTYSGITFKNQSTLTFAYQGYTPLAPIAKYDDIAEHFGRSLLESLRTEEDSDNKQILIYTLLLHVLENMNFDMAFVFKYVAVLVEKIGVVWGPENIHHALIALSQVANVYHLFQHVENSEAVAAHVVAELTKFIERYFTPGIKKEFIEDVVVEAFFCIIDWILQPNQWLLHSSKIVIAILGCIEIATTGRKTGATGTYHPATARAREAGEYLLYYLLNQFGQFPPPTGPTQLSTPLKEPDLLSADNLTAKNVQCFMFDKTLVSVVSYPRKDGIDLALLLRDQSGRYNWNVTLNLFPSGVQLAADPPGDTDVMLPPPLAPQEADDEFLQELGSFLDENSHRMHGAILRQASERSTIEDNHLVQNNYGLSHNVSVQPPPKPTSDASKFDSVAARLFLSQSGFLSLENRNHFQALQVSAQRPFNMLQNFKNLDLTPQRECFGVGVLYVNRQVRPEPWETQDATRSYFDFIRYLGWEVELVSHLGYMGSLDPMTTGETAPYWSNHLFEVIFLVATMMPNGEPAQMQATKKRLVNGAPVVITWVEDGEDFDGTSALAPDQCANIVVIPLRSGLYRIRVFKKAGFGFFGPLLNDVVVSRHILPYCVRVTAVQACRLAAKASPNLRPLSQRKFILEDFAKRNAVNVPISKLYGAQFAAV